MVPFLRQVARHYNKGEISSLCFVFPNRRALRFFEHYLGMEIAQAGTGPAVAPQMFTMADFVCRATGERPSDRVDLLLELYKCYAALNPGAEPLDDFIFWGDTLLGDFDDVDKYLVDPQQLFTNVSDLKSIQDDYSYLSDAQREAIEHFLRHFQSQGVVKERFLEIWRILGPLYEGFRKALREKGMAYEGMIYRDLAESLQESSVADVLGKRFPWSGEFVFVGLNALSECEKTLLRRMHTAGLAEFCWDWRSEEIQDPANKSSLFLSQFTAEFPSAFTPDPEGLPETEFNLLSVPGGIAQAKQIPSILSRCTPHPGIETAIVLPDEQLLVSVLNSIPEHVQKLNVTMGYPIGGSQMGSLLTDLSLLQMHLRPKGNEWLFYHRQVWAVASNSIVRSTLSEEGIKVLEKARKDRKYYLPQADLQGDTVLEAIFRPVVKETEPSAAQVKDICLWLQNIIVTIAVRLKEIPDMQMELDFAKVVHQTLDGLLHRELPLLPQSFFRLLTQLLGGATVPFEGEPLEGMQIMGPLELRALDFENLVILSFNEGMFPRRSVSASFIPPELRKGFGLPTYEYQDAVWAYYFYRAIQRAKRVWMVYDSRTEGLKGGEPSRYLRQLELHFGANVRHWEAISPLGKGEQEGSIAKTPEQIDALREGNLSASSIRNYLTCPVKFFYGSVKGLRPEKEVQESLDAGMFGTVLHETMKELYPDGTVLTASSLEALIKDKARIRSFVEERICFNLKTFELSGRNIVFADVICSYVDAILHEDLKLVGQDGRVLIIGTEKFAGMNIGGFRFVGFIDRLESTEPGVLRVVDYKTGRVTPEDMQFDEKTGEVPQIGLQLYLYKRLAERLAHGDTITGAIYQPADLISGGGVLEHDLDDEFCGRMDAELSRILTEISDLSVPWQRTEDEKKCMLCDFRAICGR